MTGEKKHTSGKWHRSIENSLHGTRLIYAEDGRLVADAGLITGRTDAEMDANADLIAAAPCLLSACESSLDQLVRHGENRLACSAFETERKLVAQLRKAIANAKGSVT